MNPVNCSVHLHRQKSARSGPMPFTRNCHFGNTKIKVEWGIQNVNCNVVIGFKKAKFNGQKKLLGLYGSDWIP